MLYGMSFTARPASRFVVETRNNFFAFKSAEEKGWSPSHPAHSCKDIRDSGESRGDGEYWIDPEKNGNSLKVYCDMSIDGGK